MASDLETQDNNNSCQDEQQSTDLKPKTRAGESISESSASAVKMKALVFDNV